METHVKVKITNIISQPDEKPETYELWLTGKLHRKSESIYLQYEEIQDEKKVQTTVKISQNEALILRKGAVNMRLQFKEAGNQRGKYESEYGTLEVTTKTDVLLFEETAHGGKLNLEYDLIIGGQPVGNYKFELIYTEEQL